MLCEFYLLIKREVLYFLLLNLGSVLLDLQNTAEAMLWGFLGLALKKLKAASFPVF